MVTASWGAEAKAFRRRLTVFCDTLEGQLKDLKSNVQASRRPDFNRYICATCHLCF